MKHSNDKLFGVPAVMLCSIVGCFKGGKYGSEETNYKPNPSGSPDGRAADVWGAIKEAEMKRVTIIILAALIAVQISHAGWWRTYGGEGRDIGYCVQETNDSNYVITGIFDLFNLWLFKTDTSGNTLWAKVYEGRGGRWVEETSDGYLIIAGYPGLFKTNAQGDTLWTHDFGFGARCVQETSDGNYIVVGTQEDSPLVLLKTNSDGDTLWRRTYAEPGHNFNEGNFVRETSDGGYIITGRTGIGSEEYAAFSLWLLKTDSEGDTSWTRKYGGHENGDDNGGNCGIETSDGGYIVTGFYQNRALWLLKMDENGDTLWTKTYTGGSGGVGFSVQKTIDGGFMITGGTETWVGASLSSLNKDDPSNLWLLKTDSMGDTSWTRSYGDGSVDIGYCVQQTKDSGYIITGLTLSYGSDSWDVYLLKTDSLGLLGIDEEPTPDEGNNWQFLSSIGSQVMLRYFNASIGLQVSIYDPTGRKVDQIQKSNPSGVFIWGYGYPPGVYFFRIDDNNNNPSTIKVVIVR